MSKRKSKTESAPVPEPEPRRPWTREEIEQYIVDARAPGTGWQLIATGLNELGINDSGGKRWSIARVKKAYDAHPDQVPSYAPSSSVPGRNVLEDLVFVDGDRLRPLPGTVVGRRQL